MICTEKRLTLCLLLLGAALLFIWGNSLKTGAVSGAMSGRVLAWLNSILHLDAQGAKLLHLLIRKMAHFAEFTGLGLLLGWLFGMTGKKKGHKVLLPLALGAAVACVDETIQYFVPGRGPSLTDVGIDLAGVCAGMILLLIGHHYIRRKNNNMEEI